MAEPKIGETQAQETEGNNERAISGRPRDRRSNGAARSAQRKTSSNRDHETSRGALGGINESQLASGLGWLSIGLGLAEIIAPRGVTKLIGVRGNYDGMVRALGAREIASGVAILTQRRPAGAAWSRVVGDVIDLALLGTAISLPKANRGRLAAATAAVAGVTALDVISSQRLSPRSSATAAAGASRVAQAVTINRAPEELYQFWRDFRNLPRFMRHLESVEIDRGRDQTVGDRRSRWVAKAPAGMKVEWDAEILEDRPNEMIAWRSLEGSDVDHMGSVRFERLLGDRGTLVRVRIQYNPPAGVIGAAIAQLFSENPNWQVKDDLRRFKQLMETGEIITTEGQPSGRASSTSWLYDAASRNS